MAKEIPGSDPTTVFLGEVRYTPKMARPFNLESVAAAMPGTSASPMETFQGALYNMHHARRGVALIFNGRNFDDGDLGSPHGASHDGDALQEVLTMLSFDVRYFEDLPLARIQKELIAVSMEDHSEADCLFVAVMTHGGQGGMLHAKDCHYNIQDVWSPFTADKVPTLSGKPKIFLLQASNVTRVEGADKPAVTGNRHLSFPTHDDILIVHSSIKGCHPNGGSLYLQNFCQEMRQNAIRLDLSPFFFDKVGHKVMMDGRTQRTVDGQNLETRMPVIFSTLTKCFHTDSG